MAGSTPFNLIASIIVNIRMSRFSRSIILGGDAIQAHLHCSDGLRSWRQCYNSWRWSKTFNPGWLAALHSTLSDLALSIYAWAASDGPIYSGVMLYNVTSTAQMGCACRSNATAHVHGLRRSIRDGRQHSIHPYGIHRCLYTHETLFTVHSTSWWCYTMSLALLRRVAYVEAMLQLM